MTETMTETIIETGMETETRPMRGMSIADMPWKDPEVLPPTDLPYSDGEPMESPWHVDNAALLKASYVAARGGRRDDYFVGTNMFVYYSSHQVRNQDYKGPDFYVVKEVDGSRRRFSWVVWEENGRYPDVIIELLSPSTEDNDLGEKKALYEKTFRTGEYFCVGLDVERLQGWRLERRRYRAIVADERGWLWSEELGLWLGAWRGAFLGEEGTWLRFYHKDGTLVLLPEEAERQRADTERQRADTAEERLAAVEREHNQALQAERERNAALQAELEQLKAAMKK